MNDENPPFFATPNLPPTELRALKDALAELLDRGSILGFEPRTRDQYQRASGPWYDQLRGTLALLDMELVNDDERLILQARPLDSCALHLRFDQTESLWVLALWKVYDEHRQAGKAGAVILSLDEFFAKLKSYLPNLLQNPPKAGTYNRILSAFQRRNLVRYSWNETSPGQSELQVLPTVLYVMPFAGLDAWATQMEKFGNPDTSNPQESISADEP